ncbi:MAG: ABC transporter permease subunit [Solirubrobacterales bacterium]|nr:ABC transporter permease subunit [Solirubrobacterales bacterium]
MRGPGRSRASMLALYGGLTALSLLWLVPVASAFMISVLPQEQSRDGWWSFDLSDLTFGNYERAWNEGLSDYVLNSFVITTLAVLLTVATGVLAAYAFARLRFRLKRSTYFLLITTMIVPVQIILIPMLPWFKTLGFEEGGLQYVGIVLVHTAFGAGWAIFMLSSFISEIPDEIIDAARVDGAGDWGIFRRVVLPLTVPGIVSFAIIDFVFVWNDLLLALTLLGRDYQPITVGLANLQSPNLAQQDIVAAGSIIAILPPLLLFALLNRLYVRGLFAGGLKG